MSPCPNAAFPKAEIMGREAMGQGEFSPDEGQLGCAPLCVSRWMQVDSAPAQAEGALVAALRLKHAGPP